MKNSLLSLLFFYIPFLSFSQSNYNSGYIVNLKGDTVKGYVDYKEWAINPKSVNFKATPADKQTQTISVKNVAAFGITGFEYFQRFIVQVSSASVETSRLSGSLDTSFSVDTVFLKSITSGKNLSLYSFTDATKVRFYVEDNRDKTIKELEYYLYFDNSSIQTLYPYRKLLTMLAIDYQPGNTHLVDKIQRADYSEPEIKPIIKAINGGENDKFQHEKLSVLSFFAGAGVKTSKLAFGGTQGPFPDGTNRSSTSPTISAGLNLLVNKNTRKISVRIEAMFSSDSYNFYNTIQTALKTGARLDFKQTNISVIPQIIYNFYTGNNVCAFFNAGIAFNLSSYNNYNYISYFADETTTTQIKYPAFDKIWPSFPIRAGILVNKRIEIFAAYLIPTSINSDVNYSSKVSSYMAGINYIFGGK